MHTSGVSNKKKLKVLKKNLDGTLVCFGERCNAAIRKEEGESTVFQPKWQTFLE